MPSSDPTPAGPARGEQPRTASPGPAAASANIVLVLGGTSDIGRATALAYATNGWKVQLAGRDVTALQREANDILTRSGHEVRRDADHTVTVHRFDVLDTASFAGFVDSLP